MNNTKKLCALLLALVMTVAMLAGCGGVINTNLTVDKNFAGKRTITVTISKDNLSEYVSGGINALKKVADSNIPKQMTCSVASNASGSTLTFVVGFKNIDEYREKVKAIIAAGSNKELTPEISYENLNTVFKKGVKFNENFTSFDLLQWYFDALQKSKIITHETTSNWYEMGDSTLSVDGTKYTTSSKFSVSEQELTCLSDIDVDTTMNIDGSFKRSFVFSASSSTVEALKEQNCDLASYLSKLTPENDSFEKASDGSNQYTITINAKDAKELVQKTNKILQTNNAFSVDIQLDKKNLGMAKLKIQEKLDGSYYLNYGYSNPLKSTLNLFDNVSFADTEDSDASVKDDAFSYYPSQSETSTFNFDWKISFAKVEIAQNISSTNHAAVDFIFTSEETMSDELKKSAIDALKQRCGENGEFAETEEGCKLSFSGSIDSINEQIGKMLSADEKAVEGKNYFNIELEKTDTSSKFTYGFSGTISYDLSPLIGNTRVHFNDEDGLFADYYYYNNFSTDSDGDRTAASSGNVSFTLIKLSILMLVLVTVFAACIIAGAVMLVLQRKKLVELIKSLMAKKPKKAENADTSAPQPSNEKEADESICEIEELAAEEAPADEAPADEAPADEVPADEAPADEAPAKEAPAEEAPADEVPADEAHADTDEDETEEIL